MKISHGKHSEARNTGKFRKEACSRNLEGWIQLGTLVPTFSLRAKFHFLDGSVVRTLHSSAGAAGSIPGQGTNIPHATAKNFFKKKNKVPNYEARA